MDPDRQKRATDSDGRIPVSVLTGFLGSGKTTLLNELMRSPDMKGTAVLINEFGSVGVDHHLVDSIDDTTVLLDSGCLCCATNGDLVRALRQLHDRMARREIPPIRRVVIETSGLADPTPVVNTLMEDRHIAVRYICDGVLTVIDASLCFDQLRDYPEASRQASMADLLLISKCDLVNMERRKAVLAELKAVNPTAPTIEMRPGSAAPDRLFAAGIYAGVSQADRISRWFGAQPESSGRHRLDDAFRIGSFVVTFDVPVAWRSFAVAMGRIMVRYGNRLLRVKGLMRALGETAPIVVHCVQDNAYAPVRLKNWPDKGPFADGRGRIVFIGKGFDAELEADIRRSLADLPGASAAVQQLAVTPNLPTRCWLDARLPILRGGSFETDAWIVMPRRYGGESKLEAMG
jgi:G3E family GTPase